MAARDNLNGTQFPMFVRAGDLADPAQYHLPEDDDYGRERVERMKLANARRGRVDNVWAPAAPGEPTFYDSVAAEGVREPVQIFHSRSGELPMVRNGQHRILTANHHNADGYVPVEWH